jgi:DNA-binding NtrC family response regulator
MGAPYVEKPFDPYQLIELIEELMENEAGVEKRTPSSTRMRQDDGL